MTTWTVDGAEGKERGFITGYIKDNLPKSDRWYHISYQPQNDNVVYFDPANTIHSDMNFIFSLRIFERAIITEGTETTFTITLSATENYDSATVYIVVQGLDPTQFNS